MGSGISDSWVEGLGFMAVFGDFRLLFPAIPSRARPLRLHQESDRQLWVELPAGSWSVDAKPTW